MGGTRLDNGHLHLIQVISLIIVSRSISTAASTTSTGSTAGTAAGTISTGTAALAAKQLLLANSANQLL